MLVVLAGAVTLLGLAGRACDPRLRLSRRGTRLQRGRGRPAGAADGHHPGRLPGGQRVLCRAPWRPAGRRGDDGPDDLDSRFRRSHGGRRVFGLGPLGPLPRECRRAGGHRHLELDRHPPVGSRPSTEAGDVDRPGREGLPRPLRPGPALAGRRRGRLPMGQGGPVPVRRLDRGDVLPDRHQPGPAGQGPGPSPPGPAAGGHRRVTTSGSRSDGGALRAHGPGRNGLRGGDPGRDLRVRAGVRPAVVGRRSRRSATPPPPPACSWSRRPSTW